MFELPANGIQSSLGVFLFSIQTLRGVLHGSKHMLSGE